LRVGQPPFFGSDTIDSSVLWTSGVWHRVVFWRDFANMVCGLVVDNNPPDTTPIINGGVGNSQYLFFGPNTSIVEPSYDEIGYWIGYVWTAADRAYDWNGGAGRTWP